MYLLVRCKWKHTSFMYDSCQTDHKTILTPNLNSRRQSNQSRMRDVLSDNWPDPFKTVNSHEIPQKTEGTFQKLHKGRSIQNSAMTFIWVLDLQTKLQKLFGRTISSFEYGLLLHNDLTELMFSSLNDFFRKRMLNHLSGWSEAFRLGVINTTFFQMTLLKYTCV